jgi:hypothetical protein
MVTVLRAGSLRVVIYVNDHAPAHVHVIGDGEAKITLGLDGGPPELLWAVEMTAAEIRGTMGMATGHRTILLQRW